MQSDDEKRSLFAELAARRSRSADLTQRAIEQGVAVVEIPADPQATDCLPAESTEEAVDASTEAPEAAGEGTAEDAIARSEPFLEPEPEMPEDLEDSMEAEKLADQIGQVVDIQRLPKTKPMRVLSKASRTATGNAASPKAPEKTEAAGMPVESGDPASEARRPAKKKRATLLDSYFKGL